MTAQIPGYQIRELIAEGGMATVYLAEQESLGRCVALKFLKKSGILLETERFLREGRIIASLHHRSIITIHDIGSVDDHHFLSMEFLEAGSLQRPIQEGFEPGRALELVQGVAECLEFVHQRGIVHRDIKPGNILLRADGTPVLTDFGLARELHRDSALTQDGTALGSPDYLSPEQALGKTIDGRADLYSLGVVLYEMLSGQKPFQGDSPIEVIVAHISKPVPQLPSHLASYQPLINRLLAKSPEDRLACAGALVGMIKELRREPASPRWPDRPRLARSWAAMRKQQSWLLPTLLVLGAGTTAVAWVGTSARPDKSAAPTSLNAGKRDAAMTPDSEPSIANEAPGADLVVDSEPAPVDMQASAIDEVDAHNRSGQIIDDYLRRAEQSLQAYRLTTPAADSAYYYYSEILKRVPDHPAARQGFVRIGDSYAALGERALQRSAYAEAKNYLDRGLSVDPGNLRLRALRSRSTPSKDLSHRVQERLKAWF